MIIYGSAFKTPIWFFLGSGHWFPNRPASNGSNNATSSSTPGTTGLGRAGMAVIRGTHDVHTSQKMAPAPVPTTEMAGINGDFT